MNKLQPQNPATKPLTRSNVFTNSSFPIKNEDAFYGLNRKTLLNKSIKNKEKINLKKSDHKEFSHRWEMTDYDDDHFELLTFLVRTK